MRKLTLAFSTAALALSGAAFAQTAPAERPARAAMPDMTRADAQARAEQMFARMDANQDGTLNEADRAARQAAMFDRIDADNNGSISRAEFDAMHAKRGEMGKGAAGHRMGGKGAGGRHAMMGIMAGPVTRQAFVERALARFDRADANRDGTVTQAERESMRGQSRAQRQQG